MLWSTSLVCFILIFANAVYSLEIEPRSSCSEHFLNGQFQTKVLPIKYGNEVYNLECVMPKSGSNFPNLLVETTIRNAGEKWHDLLSEKRSIGYQASNWEFLQKIIESNKCEQELTFDWRPFVVDGHTQAFEIQSISEKRQEFVADHKKAATQTITLKNEDPVGVVHLVPTGNSSSFTAKVKLSALRCRQSVVENKKCEVELNSAQDKISIATSSVNELSFSFKTDKPNAGFMRLVSGSNFVDIRLEDGYFITLNNVRYPIRFLTDGNFHGVSVNFKTKTLLIDGKDSFVSFDSPVLKKGIDEVLILVNGSVTAIRLDQGNWLCQGSPYLTVTASAAILRQLCPAGEASFCQCKAPLSVLRIRSSQNVEKCSVPNPEKAFTLSRDNSKLAFFYLNSSIMQSASVVFKSDASSGLIMFGQRKTRKNSQEMERFHVHYVGNSIVAGACLHAGMNQWSCQTCKIVRPDGLAKNEWIRVSLFDIGAFMYLAVDEQICKLSRNLAYFESHEFYKAPETSSFLFIGGAFYKKDDKMQSQILYSFKSDFYDLTNVKAPSIRGCIAEIRLDGHEINLPDQLKLQSKNTLNEPRNRDNLFSIKKGCQECDLACEGACRVQSGKQICDCSEQFEGVLSEEKCGNGNDFDIWMNSTDPVSLTLSSSPGLKHVTKFWTLLRIPQINKELTPIIDFGEFSILVGGYGTKIAIQSEVYGLNQEFEVSDDKSERLHVISIEEAPSIYDSGKNYNLRVDSEIHLVKFDFPTHFQKFDITITSLKNVVGSKKFGGCIQALGYKVESDDAKEGHKLELVNAIRQMHNSNDALSRNISKLQMGNGQSCGIYDPNFFVPGMPSSSLGFVGEFDPYGERQTSIRNDGDSNTGFWVLIFLAIVVILLILCIVGLLVISRYGRKTYNVKERGGKMEEVQPLYRNEEVIQNGSTFIGPATNHSPPQEQPTKITVISNKQEPIQSAAIVSKDDL